MSVNKVQLANGETIIDISDSTVTPETLAEGVTAHDASGQKITGKMAPGGGSSVQSDWNQTDSSAADFIKNKPFGEFPTGGDTLALGLINPETIDPSTLVGEMFLKVSDTIMTMDDLSNGYTFKADSFTAEVPPEEVGGTITQFGDGLFTFSYVFISVEERAVGVDFEGLAFPESGIYISVPIASGQVVSLTIPGYTGFPVTKKMEEKYLPGAVILYADAESYLYATEDTSDTSKRMTKAELAEAVMSGRQIYVCLMMDEGALTYWTTTMIGVTADVGMVELPDGAYFTAEYVPEG